MCDVTAQDDGFLNPKFLNYFNHATLSHFGQFDIGTISSLYVIASTSPKVPELVQDRAKIFEKGTINISTYKHEKHENKSCSACPFVHQTVKSEAVVFNFDALSKRSNTLPVNFHTLKI